MTLTEFLTARLDEDEAAECGCETNEAGDICCHHCGQRVNIRCWNCKAPRGSGPCPSPRSPRVLADVAAKRAIVEAYRLVDAEVRRLAIAEPDMASQARATRLGLRMAIQSLASVYSQHPDYDPDWKV